MSEAARTPFTEAGVPTEVHGGRVGATPLNIACFRGHADVVKLMLEHGADPTARDGQGRTPAEYARERGHAAVAEQLESPR